MSYVSLHDKKKMNIYKKQAGFTTGNFI